VKDLRQMLNLGTPRNDWRTPVLKTSSQNTTGIDELMDAVQKHREWAAQSGEAQRRNADAMRSEIQALLRERVLRDLARRLDPRSLDNVVSLVTEKRLDPYGAVDELLGPETDQ
jgi:LAO/AO transport system kinase